MALRAAARSCMAAVALGGRVSATGALPASLCRAASSDANKLTPVKQPKTAVAKTSAQDWKRVQDKQTGKHYWWNKSTDETTALGAPNPGAWQPVTDERSGQQYWWHPDTGETTSLGEPRPGVNGRQVVPIGLAAQHAGRPPSTMFQLVTYPLALGLGMGLVFAVGRVLLS